MHVTAVRLGLKIIGASFNNDSEKILQRYVSLGGFFYTVFVCILCTATFTPTAGIFFN